MGLKWISGILFFLFITELFGQQIPAISHSNIRPGVSFRGLCPVDSMTIWISGSKGTIGKTTNGGKTWSWYHIAGLEKSDFRGIDSWDSTEAWAFTSGTPAAIVRTKDGGKSWAIKFISFDSAYFFDALTLGVNGNGFVIGDPIHGKFVLGKIQQDSIMMLSNVPEALPGEAIFAASNSTLLYHENELAFVSGGAVSRLFISKTEGRDWQTPVSLKMLSGQSGKGSFAMLQQKGSFWMVGGDYRKDGDTTDNCLMMSKNRMKFPTQKPRGYRSGISFLPGKIGLICCGTNGTDYSMNDGDTWQTVRWSGAFHTVKISKNNDSTWLAGPNGRLGKIQMVLW